MHSLAQHFFVIRPSCCERSLLLGRRRMQNVQLKKAHAKRLVKYAYLRHSCRDRLHDFGNFLFIGIQFKALSLTQRSLTLHYLEFQGSGTMSIAFITWQANVPIKSKLQHPPPRANPGHLSFWKLDCSNSRPLGPKWCSNALPYSRICLWNRPFLKNNLRRLLSLQSKIINV